MFPVYVTRGLFAYRIYSFGCNLLGLVVIVVSLISASGFPYVNENKGVADLGPLNDFISV